MRVTDSFRYEQYKLTLATVKEKIDKTSLMVSSGTRILTPSDDPIGTVRGMKLQSEIDANTQYANNLASLKTSATYYSSAFDSISDLLSEAKELTVQMASDTVDEADRQTAAEQIDGIIDQLLSVANTKVSGSYIFGGIDSATAPYTMDAGGTVTFNGSADTSQVSVTSSTTMSSGFSGAQVFSVTGTNLFETLQTLKQHLEDNDLSGIQSDLDSLDACIDLTEENISAVGVYSSRIESVITTNEGRNTTLTAALTEVLQADTVSLMTDYYALTTAYQASAYCLSKLQSLSVLNYM